MKKLGLVVAMLLVVAAPAWARVDITCTNAGKVVTVNYTVVGDPNKVSGFGLDITVDSGAKIIDVSNYPLVATNGKYWVYPGSIDIVDGEVNDVGSPVADPNSAGALGGIGTSGITVEMGALYSPTGDSSPNSPPGTKTGGLWTCSGTLLSFTVDKECCVTITENATRGGVVPTDPDQNPDVNAPKFCIVGCFPNVGGTYPAQYADWVTMGSPPCWCAKPYGSGYQCDGDADGLTEGSLTKWRVSLNDLNIIIANWKKKITDPALNPCGDIDHKYEGSLTKWRVSLNDLNILIANWKKKDSALPGNCPRQ